MGARRGTFRLKLIVACTLGAWASTGLAGAEQTAQKYPYGIDPDTGEPVLVPARAAEDDEAVQVSSAAGQDPCEVLGQWGQTFGPFQSRSRGVVFQVTSEEELLELEMELLFGTAQAPVNTDLHFFIYRRLTTTPSPFDDPFTEFDEVLSFVVPSLGNGTRTFYSTGLIDPPLVLDAGFEYALGVSWGNVNVTYARGSTVAVPKFTAFAYNNAVGEPPLPDPLTTFTLSQTTGLYSMRLCLAPKPGACCLSGGSCTVITEVECLDSLGEFSEPELTCEELEAQNLGCPLRESGCCLPGGDCLNIDKFSCEDNGGVWNSSLLCAADPCAPRGACCSGQGTCSRLTEAECDAQGGVYQGDDTTCLGVGLACSRGACCVGATCAVLTESGCADQQGIWRAHGTTCTATTCAPPGACCLGTTCQDGDDGMTSAGCTAAGGVYQGNWTSCETLPVQCGRGACCVSSGCVANLSQSVCQTTLRGTFRGVGSDCAELDPLCPGTCCWQFGCLNNTTPRDCSELPDGVFAEYGQTCADDPAPCPVAGSSACCLTDGSCVAAESQTACTSLVGTWNAGLTCAAVSCSGPAPLGACCVGGECVELTAADCASEGGAFAGNLTTCSLQRCNTGACCQEDGSCADDLPGDGLTLSECQAAGGRFYANRTCADGICPQPQACCLPPSSIGAGDETCQDQTQGTCEALQGRFVASTLCSDPLLDCTRGACCQDDGTCISTIDAICTGTFTPGVTCAAADCPAGEACCKADGSCEKLTFAACSALSGAIPLGAESACTAGLCTRGACCGFDGVCTDNTVLNECPAEEASGGVFFAGECCSGPSGTCTNEQIRAECAPTGACCTAQVGCEDLTGAGCALGTEYKYQGDATSCAAGGCDPGACCLIDGTCDEEVLASRCVELDGTFFRSRACAAVCPGACCLDFGVCLETTKDDCAGTFSPAGECNGTPCGGACCLRDGTCRVTSAEGCTSLEGTFAVGVSCSPGVCQAVGACCVSEACQDDLTQAACETGQGGAYQGDASRCNDAGLDCTLGGCCRTSGTCQNNRVASQCSAPGEVFRPGQACGTFPCTGAGACCLPDELCAVGSASACGAASGFYGGNGSVCEEVSCELGGCCIPAEQVCEESTESACENVRGGFFLGVAAPCPTCSLSGLSCVSDDDCGVCSDTQQNCNTSDDCRICFGGPTPGAPCTFNAQCGVGGACQVSPTDTCDIVRVCSVSGDSCLINANCPAGETCVPRETCSSSACVEGVCCHLDGTCTLNVSAVACDEVGGEIFVPGIDECPSCPPRGACCQADGSCTVETQADCTGQGGDFAGVGQTCDPADLCQVGACCRTAGCDETLTRFQCENLGRVFAGGGSVCADGPCDAGACCLAGGACVDTVRTECAELVGTFTAGGDCGTTPCVVVGACCRQGGCEEVTSEDCTAAGGTYLGDGAPCEVPCEEPCEPFRPCDLGACCRRDGTCDGLAIISECLDATEEFFAGLGCGLADCAPKGACCVDGACQPDQTAADCESAGGTYLGDLSNCDLDICTLGACCVDSVCRETVEIDCVAGGGAFLSGISCATDPCAAAPTGACCIVGSPCQVLSAADCSVAGGTYQGDGVPCVPDPCGVACTEINFSDPLNCALDSRQPHNIDGTNPSGFNQILLNFRPLDCDASLLSPGGYVVEEVPAGAVPTWNVNAIGNEATLTLASPIEPRKWTCFSHAAVLGKVCLGFLPGDVNADRTANPAIDLGKLIDCINNPGTCSPMNTNIDRLGTDPGALDITRLIDLFNGAGAFDSATGSSLPPCPGDP